MAGLSRADWVVLKSAEDVARYALDLILKTAQQSITERDRFSLVLAGGTTPELVYRLLAETTKPQEWDKWQIYIGDERCLPADHPERNSQMARRTLLDRVPIASQNIHFIASENGADAAAKSYADIVQQALPFDLVLLGMGEDGHTASLFPGHVHDQRELVHAVFDAPKPPPERVSLSAAALSANRNLLILVTGESKREIMRQWQAGSVFPVNSIGSEGQGMVVLDKAATPES